MTSLRSTPVTAPTPVPAAGALSRPWLLVGGMVGAAVLVALAVLAGTGQLAAAPAGVSDPGATVRWGLPAARAVQDLAAALSVGLLVLAAFVVAPEPGTARAWLLGARLALVRTAAVSLGAWLVAGVVVLVLEVGDVAALSPTSPGFLSVVVSFATQLDLGRAMGVSLLLVAVATNLTVLATRVNTAAWAAALAVLALLPLALVGHAAGAADHQNSVNSLAFHLVAVSVWVGGLVALVLTARALGPQLPTVVRRYSTLAGWCFLVVALSGVVNAALRLGSWGNLGSSYGVLVIGKAVALGALGLAGLGHRRAVLGRLEGSGGRRAFLRLATVELLVMAATMGLAVALSRSAPPSATTEVDPVTALLGFPLPPPLTVHRWLTGFYPDTLWLSVAAVLLLWYLSAARRLSRRGDRWSLGRTAPWVLGCLSLAFVTSGGPAVYARTSFSAHMIQHMTLMVVVPLLLVLGAPMTLLLRTTAARPDGSLGLRETTLLVLHSRYLRVLGHPLVAAGLFTGSLVAFYYTPAFRAAMFTHTGHVLMTAHFLLTGYLFISVLVGVDPGLARPSYPLRLILLLAVLSFHAFFGLSLMTSGTVLAPDWWAALGQTDQARLLADQQVGGGIAWGTGDIPSLALGLALIFSWFRSDTRESRRSDRKADRDGDEDLRQYNERLAAISRQDQR